MIKAFFIALGLLTRIPVPKFFYVTEDDSEQLYGWSVLFYPLIGFIIGGILVFTSWGLSLLTLPTNGLIEAGILLIIWVLITGALHLDGLADSADAWLGGYGDKARTLKIMKDPRSGPVAVVILVLVLLLKFILLIHASWLVLLFAPVLARTSIMVLFATTENVRKGGMAETAVKHLPKYSTWLIFVFILSTCIYLLKAHSWVLLILFVVAYLLRRLMLQRIGGMTGDTAGAMLEIIEVVTLLLFVLAQINF